MRIRITVSRRQLYGHCIVDNGHWLNIAITCFLQGFHQQSIYILPLHTGNRKFLGPFNQSGFIYVQLLRAKGKGVPQKIGGFLIPGNGFTDNPGQKVKELITACLGTNQIIFVTHQCFFRPSYLLILAIAQQANYCGPHIGPAKIQGEKLPRFRSFRQANEGWQHLQRRILRVF